MDTAQDIDWAVMTAKLQRHASFLTSNKEDAADLVQESVCRFLEQGRNVANPVAYITTTLRNVYRDSWRRHLTVYPLDEDNNAYQIPEAEVDSAGMRPSVKQHLGVVSAALRSARSENPSAAAARMRLMRYRRQHGLTPESHEERKERWRLEYQQRKAKRPGYWRDRMREQRTTCA